jgi:LPPG:FO 2-phospho-L-lactate transferase
MYEDVMDVFVIDERDVSDRERIEALGMRVVVTDAVMGDRSDRARLAGDVLNAAELAREAVS